MTKFTTQYKANRAGAGRVIARGGGKQLTMPYDHSLSTAANHERVATAFLAAKFGLGPEHLGRTPAYTDWKVFA